MESQHRALGSSHKRSVCEGGRVGFEVYDCLHTPYSYKYYKMFPITIPMKLSHSNSTVEKYTSNIYTWSNFFKTINAFSQSHLHKYNYI